MKSKFNNFSFTSSIKTKIIKPKNLQNLIKLIKKKHTISGNCRSYNDSFIGNYLNISMSNFNKIIYLDKKNETIEVESGVSLDAINKIIIPNGYVLDCSPGCKYVSVGGMISNNINGKLSNKNSIIYKIKSLCVLDKNFKLKNCSLKKNKALFHLAIGGKGRVGPIISAVFKLRKINSDQIIQKIYNFNDYRSFKTKIKLIKNFEYSVVWINFLKKNFSGIYICGNHVNLKSNLSYKNNDIKLPNIFFLFFSYMINNKIFTIIFNYLFEFINFIKQKKKMHLIDFYFPQNKIKNWNYIFKKQGFIQFHFFFEEKNMSKIIDNIKNTFNKNKIYSNFAILKFHKDSYKKIKLSLSLDIPIKNNYKLIQKIINKIVLKNNLEVNLSKDIVLDSLNNKTLSTNQIFDKNNKRYLMRNNTSNLIERLASNNA